MKKRVFSLFMALALCLSMLPAAAMADESEEPVQEENGTSAQSGETHEHYLCGGNECTCPDSKKEAEYKTTLTAWTDALAQERYGAGSTAANSLPVDGPASYYLTQDVELTETWEPYAYITLCLNGHSIISDGADVAGRYVIIVESSSLVLTDCKGSGKITHADGKNGGGVSVYNPSSVFNMFGGIITGNNIDGGVNNGGTFNMYGSEISGNTATNCGGGVYVAEYSTAFNVSGSAKITGNTVNKAANNVYLPKDKTIAIGGLTGDADIGVTTAQKPTDKKHVTIVSNAGTMSYKFAHNS